MKIINRKMKLNELDKKYIWHPYTHLTSKDNIVIQRAKDAILIDEKGNRFIDAISSWWVNIHGHRNKHITNAIRRQLRKMEHVIFAGFTHIPAINLSYRLLKHLPDEQKKVFFSDNGSTAVEVALKMGVQYFKNKGFNKINIIALENSYHGDTFGSMSVSERGVFTSAFSDMLFKVSFIELPDANNIRKLKYKLRKYINDDAGNIFIYEPLVQGAGGMRIYCHEALGELLKFLRLKNTVLIADEVMTGFGRTGKFFASDYMNIKPDIFCLSKGITGGFLPMGVTTCNERICSSFVENGKNYILYHGHSYTANPISCAAAIASIKLLEKSKTWDDIIRISNNHKRFIELVKSDRKISLKLNRIDSLGVILSLELKVNDDGGYNSPIRDVIYDYFIEKRIVIRPLGNVIYIIPPYCITDEQLNYIYNEIINFLKIYENRDNNHR